MRSRRLRFRGAARPSMLPSHEGSSASGEIDEEVATRGADSGRQDAYMDIVKLRPHKEMAALAPAGILQASV
ncbi:MAG: hypothetical protein QOD94_916 [Alphaproteobacteria bacterium]|nr:hypothetical protein [Alphaproteobacteria bacterium]